MSIYASLDAPEDWHSTDCGIWVEDGEKGYVVRGDETQCTCALREAPLVYRGSHILPSMEDERGGDVDIALIPGHVFREGRESEQPPDDETPWPYLRFGVNGERVVLDTAGVQRVADTLNRWLSRVKNV